MRGRSNSGSSILGRSIFVTSTFEMSTSGTRISGSRTPDIARMISSRSSLGSRSSGRRRSVICGMYDLCGGTSGYARGRRAADEQRTEPPHRGISGYEPAVSSGRTTSDWSGIPTRRVTVPLLRRLFDFYRAQGVLLWTWRPGRRALLRRAVISFVVAFLSLGLTVWILPGISTPGPPTIALATLVLAGLNLLVRPVIVGALAGVSVVAILIATLVFQVAVFYVLSAVVPEFEVQGVPVAIVASFLYAGIDMLLVAILSVDQDESYYGVLMAQLSRHRSDVITTDVPGLVIVQIDGLAHPVLVHQIRAGRVPNISRWVRSREMRLDRWVALLPTQTSASQAGILHGNNSFIPAFRWWEKDTQRMLVSNHPEDAAEIVKRASNGEGLLSNDGASVGNLVSGDAVRA